MATRQVAKTESVGRRKFGQFMHSFGKATGHQSNALLSLRIATFRASIVKMHAPINAVLAGITVVSASAIQIALAAAANYNWLTTSIPFRRQ